MCARCARSSNIVVSSLIIVIGRLHASPMRHVAEEFAAAPSDAALQVLLRQVEPLFLEMVNGVVSEVRNFGGLRAVLEAADREHVASFNSAMNFMKGDDHAD